MYSTSHSAPMNGVAGDLVDGSGTINPAALNNVPVNLHTPADSSNIVPRGIKRSRSPEFNALTDGDHDDGTDEHARRKRGRPPKIQQRPSTADQTSSSTPAASGAQLQTPRMQTQPLPPAGAAVSPPQASPSEKTTPSKATVIKALPTVRDHTTDQLDEQGDEYIPKEFDDAGEKKVDAMGYPQGGREYKCRTFRVAPRATQVEKDDMIHQDILPYSYRSRQIAIVSARSMFRQFGSRVVVNGRRVRDDYWESKARKQGFTEEDLAGEKRPGAARRDAAAAAEAANANLLPTLTHGDVIYSNPLDGMPLPGAPSVSLSQLPIFNMTTTDDPRLREYNSMPRARQEVTGQAYQDRTQPSSAADILNQASHTADFNKILTSQRAFRHRVTDDFYANQRETAAEAAQSQPGQLEGAQESTSNSLQPTQIARGGMVNSSAPQPVMSHQSAMMGGGQSGFHPPSHPQAAIAPSPAVRAMPPGMRPDLMHQRPAALPTQTPPYGYPSQPQQMWGQPPPQPQPSPLSSTPVAGMPQYAHLHAAPQHSPSPLPHNVQQPHPSQSPRNQPRPSVPSMSQPFPIHHPQAAQQTPMAASMGFPGATAAPYPAMARTMYPATQGGGQPFMAGTPQPGLAMGMSAGGGIPGWPSAAGGTLPSGPPQPGQSGSPMGWSGY